MFCLVGPDFDTFGQHDMSAWATSLMSSSVRLRSSLPLGWLAQRNGVRDDKTLGTLPSHKKRLLEDKESVKWLESVEALRTAREVSPETT
jgi:hypothetical protein